jgi:hypothetical protein
LDETPASIRTLLGFTFDPSTVTSLIINDDNEEKEEYNQKKTRVEKIRTNMY